MDLEARWSSCPRWSCSSGERLDAPGGDLRRPYGYLVSATAFFGFFLLLSLLWSFEAPGTNPFLGPKGALPTWVGVAAGEELTAPGCRWWSSTRMDLGAGRWGRGRGIAGTFQEFLAEEATVELQQAGVEGEPTAEQFEVADIFVTTAGGTELAAARAFSTTGGREVEVAGCFDLARSRPSASRSGSRWSDWWCTSR